MNERPNFVFLMTDTQRADMVGCYGLAEMRTWNLDALAQTGLRFTRAFTTCPVCSPARAGIFTGMMPSKAGVSTNNLPLGRTIYHMGERFAALGYATAYTGKWHLDGHEPEPILDGHSFAPLLRGQAETADRGVLMEFHRHSLSHDGWGGFVPIRCLVRGRYKLVINLLGTDELYDLDEDPHEVRNRIDDAVLAGPRDEMMDALLGRMNRTRDPFRGPCWEDRPWRTRRTLGFWGAYRMKPEDGFSSTPRVYATGQPEEA